MSKRTTPRKQPKFKAGQIVKVMGSSKFREFTGDYWIIGGCVFDKTDQYIYRQSVGPWVAEKMLRPLTRREAGR